MISYQVAANSKTAYRNMTFRSQVLQFAEGEETEDVCDIGGGPNPLLSRAQIEQTKVSYTLLDISPRQLAKAPAGYRTLLTDITNPPSEAHQTFDLVFSQWVAEHVPNGQAFHEGVRLLLKPGGRAVHLYPTLFAIPFVLNKLLPEGFSYPLANVRLFRPGPKRDLTGKFGKFPAYYQWCYGPTKRQIQRLESVGFEVERFTAFFGHGYYSKLGPLARGEDHLSSWLVDHPIPTLTSSAIVVLRRV